MYLFTPIPYNTQTTVQLKKKSYSTIADSQETIGKVSDRLGRFLEDRDLDINANKTEFMLFRDSQSVETVTEAKFPGIILTSDCNFNTHLDKKLFLTQEDTSRFFTTS